MNIDLKRNVGNVDRIIRISLGITLLLLPSFVNLTPTLDWIFYIIGIFGIIEGVLGY